MAATGAVVVVVVVTAAVVVVTTAVVLVVVAAAVVVVKASPLPPQAESRTARARTAPMTSLRFKESPSVEGRA